MCHRGAARRLVLDAHLVLVAFDRLEGHVLPARSRLRLERLRIAEVRRHAIVEVVDPAQPARERLGVQRGRRDPAGRDGGGLAHRARPVIASAQQHGEAVDLDLVLEIQARLILAGRRVGRESRHRNVLMVIRVQHVQRRRAAEAGQRVGLDVLIIEAQQHRVAEGAGVEARLQVVVDGQRAHIHVGRDRGALLIEVVRVQIAEVRIGRTVDAARWSST
ncbi:hypothetical protein G6F59_014721 [Rhizopus arrhizus]|nr:hypothetical protein G6F59_014721 [Rhizopus arrhizus]